MLNFYTWTSFSNKLDNTTWFINSINWEDSSFLLDSDIFFILNLVTEFFFSNFFSTFMASYFSFFDFWLLSFYNSNLDNLYNSFFFDFWIYINSFFNSNTLNFLSNNFDYLLFYSFLDFSFLSFFFDYNIAINLIIFQNKVVLMYDTFFLSLGFSYLDYITYLKWFFIFFSGFLFFVSIVRFRTLSNLRDFLVTRLFHFFSSMGFENRIQLDLIVSFLFFLFFVWVLVLIAFDDLNSEVVELFHIFLIIIFFFITFYLLYKYSIHYFSFLENTVSDGFSTSFITKQMVRDISNTFALFLRIFLLLFRLNIYDGLDDFLDSYYIFVCDFDDDSYFDEDTFHSNAFFYFKDNQEDNVFFHPNEQDWFDDLFARYFVIWGKLFLFLFFILEELFRVSLALYIFYLIIFEVHSVNLSYIEDTFIFSKKHN